MAVPDLKKGIWEYDLWRRGNNDNVYIYIYADRPALPIPMLMLEEKKFNSESYIFC